MASPFRSAGVHSNGLNPNVTQLDALAVAPLNSMPYIGPPAPSGDSSCSSEVDNQPPDQENAGPTVIFLPPNITKEEWNNAIPYGTAGVALSGSAAMGKMGHIVGLMDIGESKDNYFFRVSLPGVSTDQNDFSCDIQSDGTVIIKGITTTGEETVCKMSQVFKMQTQNLCPPGRFSVKFRLPGPVENESFQGRFANGMLVGLIKKNKGPGSTAYEQG